MKFAAAKLILFALLCSVPHGWTQGIQVDLEDFRRLQGEVADLRDAKNADQKRIAELSRKVAQLQTDLRSAEDRTTIKLGEFITRDDLKEVIDRTISKVDQSRENDKKIILEQFEKLTKIVAEPRTGGSSRSGGTRREPTREPEKDKEKEPEQIEGTFIEHKVKEGDTFGQILQDFNGALKEEGRPAVNYSQVKKANPKIDLNRIRVGQTILLPVTEKK